MNKLIKKLFLTPFITAQFLICGNMTQIAPEPTYTPENTAFFFDVDDVILDKSYWTITGIILKNSWTITKALCNWQRFKSAWNQKDRVADAWKEWGRKNYPPVEQLITDIQQSKYPNTATVAIVEQLLDQGFDLYEATNMGLDEFAQHKEKYTFFQRFKSGKTVNYKVKPIIKKPNHQYFAELAELAPAIEHKIFIDDKLKNVEAAQKAGFIGMHFTTPEQLQEDLTTMKVLKKYPVAIAA